MSVAEATTASDARAPAAPPAGRSATDHEAGTAVPRRPLRVLTFSSLYPSTARPRHGIFVETRLRHLVRDCGIDARVVAPVPWFPFRARAFGHYADFAATPAREQRHGVDVRYPRYLMVPRWGVAFQPDSMARAGARAIAELARGGWLPDLIDAHYFYPDGVAAAILAQRLGLPLVITARGTDINLIARLPGPGRRIAWAAQRADALAAVSAPLRDALLDLGAPAAKVSVLRNGVDAELFRPAERAPARARFALPPEATVLACVGNLVPEKGQDLAIETVARLPDAHLLLVGAGPARQALGELAERLGVASRVHFLPVMPQADLCDVYTAADVLLLPSTREGWPNVVLEALACGTPVVAADVGAVRDMLDADTLGRVVGERAPQRWVEAVSGLLATRGQREQLRRHAMRFDWPSVSRAQAELFERLVTARTTR